MWRFLTQLWQALTGAPTGSPVTPLPNPEPAPKPEPEPAPKPVQTNRFAVKGAKLYRDGKPVEFTASPNKSAGALAPQFLIMHYTANGSLAGTVGYFQKPSSKVSAHIVLGRDGDVRQMLSFDQIGWHAGNSSVTSKWGTPYKQINNRSIGIEMVNYGYAGSHVPGSVKTEDWPRLRHYKETSLRKWQAYTDTQWEAAVDMAVVICKAYGIPVEHIKGHDEVSTSGKVDPGPAFDMNRFRAAVADKLRST